MTEDEYQLGIRDLSKHDLVTLINGYRKGLKDLLGMLTYLAEHDSLQMNELVQEMFKVTKENLLAKVEDFQKVLEDYRG
jgi:Holliday junction resolvasome RuvABC ATP-dependent DNA helicase subunit